MTVWESRTPPDKHYGAGTPGGETFPPGGASHIRGLHRIPRPGVVRMTTGTPPRAATPQETQETRGDLPPASAHPPNIHHPPGITRRGGPAHCTPATPAPDKHAPGRYAPAGRAPQSGRVRRRQQRRAARCGGVLGAWRLFVGQWQGKGRTATPRVWAVLIEQSTPGRAYWAGGCSGRALVRASAGRVARAARTPPARRATRSKVARGRSRHKQVRCP